MPSRRVAARAWGGDMKRLVLFFDGTWNSETRAGEVTNVFRLKELVEEANRSSVPGDPEQRIFYDRGVGTRGAIDRVTGGVFGVGLAGNVRQGYRFLSQFWEHGPDGPDEIYVFGFSRGAFTARSLAGFVAAAGLLKKQNCDEENLARAWNYYRTPVKSRFPADKARLEGLCHPGVRVDLVGVFDTVGSLGIPTGTAGNWAGSFDRFHDTKLGSSIDVALQAIALDEHRGPFVPALFARPDHHGNKFVEQVWFPGVHSDVGGGYGDRGRPDRTPISDITLDWMVRRIGASGVGLRIAAPSIRRAAPGGLVAVPDDPHDSLGWFVLDRLRPMYRLVEGMPLSRPPQGAHRSYGLAFPDVSWREKVHRSVFDLVLAGTTYRPPQVHDVLAALARGQATLVEADGTDMTAPDAAALAARVAAAMP